MHAGSGKCEVTEGQGEEEACTFILLLHMWGGNEVLIRND